MPNTKCQIPAYQHKNGNIQNTKYKIPNPKYQTQAIAYQIPHIKYNISNSIYQISTINQHISNVKYTNIKCNI